MNCLLLIDTEYLPSADFPGTNKNRKKKQILMLKCNIIYSPGAISGAIWDILSCTGISCGNLQIVKMHGGKVLDIPKNRT